MDKNTCVVLFHSTSLAIRGEKIAKSAGVNVKLVPTPRHLSSDCGIALRFNAADEDTIVEVFKRSNLDYDRISPL